jgi:hypothetical protein
MKNYWLKKRHSKEMERLKNKLQNFKFNFDGRLDYVDLKFHETPDKTVNRSYDKEGYYK